MTRLQVYPVSLYVLMGVASAYVHAQDAPASPSTAASNAMDAMPGMNMQPAPSAMPMPTPTSKASQANASAVAPEKTPSSPPQHTATQPSQSNPTAAMGDMGMHDRMLQSMLLVDQLEGFDGRTAHGLAWEAEAYLGEDIDKAWFRTEGEQSAGIAQNADIEALWSHAVSAFWNTQLGVRHDIGVGPDQTWAAFGIQGMAPYGLDIEATGYAGDSGRTAARLRIEYDLRLSQRWLLQPEWETNLYGKRDAPPGQIGDVSDTQLGVRLRYEITRQCAPYVGVVWTRHFGTPEDIYPLRREPVFDQQFVAGVRFWF